MVLPARLPEAEFPERAGRVATITLLAKLSAMAIVHPVTGVTAARRAFDFFDLLCVAGVAVYLVVGAFQLEFALRIVIEAPDIPAVRVMALGAGLAQTLAVHVIFFVALVTGAFNRPVVGVRVTFLTGGDGVQPNQGKTGHVMIKDGFLAPAFLVVTARAETVLVSFLAAMHVIELVTVVAEERQTFLV